MASTMQQPAPVTIARPKRKRAVVSYAESQEAQRDGELSDEGYSSSFIESKKTKKARTGAQKKIKSQAKPFPFMKLPFELREMIYKLALTSENGQKITAVSKKQRHTVERTFKPEAKHVEVHQHWRAVSTGSYDGGAPATSSYYRQRYHQATSDTADTISPQLLAVSRAIHSETVNILYGQTFSFQSTRALHDFLTTIGSENQARLLYITLLEYHRNSRSAECHYNYPALTALGGAVNLRSLYIAGNLSFYGGKNHGKQMAGQIYRDGFRFMEKYGQANGDRLAAIKIIRFHADNFKTWGRDTTSEDTAQAYQQHLKKLLQQSKF